MYLFLSLDRKDLGQTQARIALASWKKINTDLGLVQSLCGAILEDEMDPGKTTYQRLLVTRVRRGGNVTPVLQVGYCLPTSFSSPIQSAGYYFQSHTLPGTGVPEEPPFSTWHLLRFKGPFSRALSGWYKAGEYQRRWRLTSGTTSLELPAPGGLPGSIITSLQQASEDTVLLLQTTFVPPSLPWGPLTQCRSATVFFCCFCLDLLLCFQ